MKKIVLIASLFAAVAIAGTALTGASTDEASSSSTGSEDSTKQCCQVKSVEENRDFGETPKPSCCPTGKAKATVLAKAESSRGDSCKSAQQTAGNCKLCATDEATTPVASTSEETIQCRAGSAGPCGGQSDAVKVASTAEAAVERCVGCSGEDCKEECSRCAEARKEAAAAETDVSASVGRSHGMRNGHAGDSQHQKDHNDFFFLIEHRDSIRRTIENLPNGVETLTESDVVDVASMIQVHVAAMYARLENANPIRMRDPIFREIFANADKIEMTVERTDHGVRVKETSDDVYVVKLLQEHAKVVSLWIRNGYAELPKNHAPPKR